MGTTVLHSFPVWLPQTQTWMYGQVAELQRQGLDTHVACERTENLDQFNVENIHCLANKPEWHQMLEKAQRLLGINQGANHTSTIGKKIGANVVHSHFGHIGWRNMAAVRKLHARHIVTFYGLDVNKLPVQSSSWRQRYRKLFDQVDLILCEGSHMARCIVALGCVPEKVHVQHLGVDTTRIEFRPRSWQSGQPLRVLIAASFREKKGIPYAIKALGLLRKDVNIELTIIGDAGNDSASLREKKIIQAALADSGFSSDVRLLGYQPHAVLLSEAYQHHVFLSPSITASDGDTEGGAPVSLIEMAASGMPIVSTRHCDIPEIIKHGVSGLLAEERDVNSLTCHLKWLIEHPANWAEMLFSGRHHVEQEYDLRTQGRKLAGIYEKLLF